MRFFILVKYLMNLSFSEIKSRLNSPLPGLKSHLKLAPEHRADELAAMNGNMSSARKSAVMILLFHDADKLKVVYIRRSVYEGVHSGQIAFPGGRYEKTDADIQATAFRETEEEIGLPAGNIQLLARLSDIYVPPSNFLISVFAGYLSQRPVYKLQEREVDAILEIDVDDLCQPDVVQEKEFVVSSGKKSVKARYFRTPNADIWGASAMITAELLDLLHHE